jgi:NADPH-dependent 2,4-dienoyl-CoA reductase/sulfur reductase-like enzyme
VNPTWGLEHKIDSMISPPEYRKRVAVIGGGPSGMEAALIASQRGHDVTLYEKSGRLGGLFNTYGEISFKWTYKEYKEYLIRQIEKSRVTVHLNTEATPAMIQKEGFDAVIAAIGAEPIVPDVPGINGQNVVYAPDVFGKEETLAQDVVVIGGGVAGTETGMHLASRGHRVTVLEKSHFLARDRFFIHFWSSVKLAWEQLPGFSYILQARFNGVTKDGVTYIDAEGKQQSLKAGSVVVAAGMKAKDDLAFSFHDAGRRLYMVGDCREASNIENAIRTAFNTAVML